MGACPSLVLAIRVFGWEPFGLFGFQVIWVGMFRNGLGNRHRFASGNIIGLEVIFFSHVGRSCNVRADSLARNALLHSSSVTY
ncbi:hypothetical protein DY000_02058094 [Brassica cretica]|uniref:RNase H type-1 domain-containing protein n=1 Tax=Brassica cretica TaxID=69181 RepID=A0ABQ7AIX0_BRACR|nr:hypothetical protein DY000_02058094 [Brassica cretica]